jgi:uncharacterized protein YbaP (TraB family)
MDAKNSSEDSSNPIHKNTKTSLSVSNLQLAVNAIVNLASKIGSIYSIVNSADCESDIYRKISKIQKDIKKTADNAQKGILNLLEIEKSVDDISELSNNIIRKKVYNPLISDDLVVIVTNCVIDAKKALSLTRSALK